MLSRNENASFPDRGLVKGQNRRSPTGFSFALAASIFQIFKSSFEISSTNPLEEESDGFSLA